MGIVPDESNLYNEMDGFENLCSALPVWDAQGRTRVEG